MKLLIMQSSPAPRHFLLGPNILLSTLFSISTHVVVATKLMTNYLCTLNVNVDSKQVLCYFSYLIVRAGHYIRGCNQNFPDWVDNEITNNRHSLRSNTKG